MKVCTFYTPKKCVQLMYSCQLDCRFYNQYSQSLLTVYSIVIALRMRDGESHLSISAKKKFWKTGYLDLRRSENSSGRRSTSKAPFATGIIVLTSFLEGISITKRIYVGGSKSSETTHISRGNIRRNYIKL